MSATAIDRGRILAPDNVELPVGAASLWWRGLVITGLFLIVAAFLGGGGDAKSASVSLHAVHTGFLSAVGWPIGALGFVMILHLMKAGWAGTIRRVFEAMMSLVWVGAALFAVVVAMQIFFAVWHSGAGKDAPYLWNWMNAEYVAGDALYAQKAPFLNLWFFGVRQVIYFGVLWALASSLWSLSRRQDEDADKWHTVSAVRISAPGVLLYAFIVAFAGFDWLMALDFHWFSTMLGVYFFAVGMAASLALGTAALLVLRTFGRLHGGVFTEEHLHDLGKLVFAFIVFWGYIAFSQYFLIWYSNIPEETTFFMLRKGQTGVDGAGLWAALSWIVPIAKFVVPFILLLPRPLRRIRGVMLLACAWLVLMQLVELYWMVRPEAKAGFRWMDVAGVLGPPMIMLGMFIRRLSTAPLVAVNDPRMDEALAHRNTI